MRKKLFSVLLISILFVSSVAFAGGHSQTIDLKTGFNFISLVLNPDATSAIEIKKQFSNVDDIYSYSSSAGSFASVNEGTLIGLNAGLGYIIKASSPKPISITGTAVSTVGDIKLKPGFNLAGFSKVSEIIKFSELMTKFSVIKGMYKWNASSGSFIQVTKTNNSSELLDGVDPAVTGGQSYFVDLASDAVLNYDAGSISIASSGGTPPPGGTTPPPGGTTPPGGDSTTEVSSATAVYTLSAIKETKDSVEISASATDQSAVKVTDGGNLTLKNSSISSSGNTSSMDNSSFYGLNAAVLAVKSGVIILSDTVVNTTGSGANGVFAYGEGSRIDMTNLKINCVATGAHGVDATGGAILNMKNVDIITAGNGAAAAIATDRGGGTINVEGGIVKTTGTKSPGIYSTGIITATGTKITTTVSEAITIEGKNTVTLNNCTLSSGKNNGAFIYQSFSGDASVGTGIFNMNGGSMTAAEGPVFYSTNTTAEINLKNADITSASGILLKAGADSWGTA
ncbi:MAG TPA: hypothetical protein PKK26_19225, partial [Candidatus Wallbacteria bacterium]|nr:hypothetical protein [Candidatus Wallbacteria bacterium]